jgi:hypothetical protein
MKILVWSLCAVLALLWTGPAALVAQATRWIASGLASGQIKDFASGAAQWPKPEGLPAWTDPQWIEVAQSAVIAALSFFAELSPYLSSMMAWMVPLVWVLWGIGLIFLVGLGGGAHWLIRRWQRSAPAV